MADAWGTSWGSSSAWGVTWLARDVTPPVVTVPTLSPAGRSTGGKRKRKVMIGDRLYEVDSLRDVEFLLKRVVRSEPEVVEEARKPRKRVVGRVSAKAEKPASVPVQIPAIAVDWTPLYKQLAEQDAEYARLLVKAIARQEEDDIETILLLM